MIFFFTPLKIQHHSGKKEKSFYFFFYLDYSFLNVLFRGGTIFTCLYGKNELLWVSVWPSGVFSREKTPPDYPYKS